MIKTPNSRLTVFIGIYNGSKYLTSLQEQLLSQTAQDFPIVVIDNCSKDDSWELLQEWNQLFNGRIKILRNDQNLGGAGSLERALSERIIGTEWFTCIHQDDRYFEEHVKTLQDEIMTAEDNVVAIGSSMKSMNFDGLIQPNPPRAMWLMKNNSQVDSFLLNLRTQALAWPTAAFKTEIFMRNLAPWHSPTFSDTETTLLLCGEGKFKYLDAETMAYRENPQSESHVINKLESTIGTALGLARVFSSGAFRRILKLVEPTSRSGFYEELVSSIEIRLGDSPLQKFVTLLATEECCRAFGYSELLPNKYLAENYQIIGSQFTSKLLVEKSSIAHLQEEPGLLEIFTTLSNAESQMVFNETMNGNKRNYVYSAIQHLPISIRKALFIMYVRIRAIKQPNFYWNALWQK